MTVARSNANARLSPVPVPPARAEQEALNKGEG